MLEHKTLGPLAVKFLETPGQFRATFATLDVIDREGDVTVPGAFTEGQEVRIAQWGHNWAALPIGRGVIHADEARAWVDGELFLDTAAGKESYTVIKNLSGLQEWSYGFAIKEHSFGEFGEPPRPVRFLRALDVFEISPVMLGAGVATGTDTIKGMRTLTEESEAVLAAAAGLAERLKSLADVRHKEGRTLSAANRERLGQHRDALRSIAGDLHELLVATAPEDPKRLAPIEVLELEKVRARLLGVPV